MTGEIYYLQDLNAYGDDRDSGTYNSILRSAKFLQLIEQKIGFEIGQLGRLKTGKPTALENVSKNIKV